MRPPSGDHASAKAYCATLVFHCDVPVAASHNCTVPSLPQEASVLPSGAHATPITGPLWPVYVTSALESSGTLGVAVRCGPVGVGAAPEEDGAQPATSTQRHQQSRLPAAKRVIHIVRTVTIAPARRIRSLLLRYHRPSRCGPHGKGV